MIKRFEGQSEDRRNGVSVGEKEDQEKKGADRGANTVWAEQTAIEKEELIKIQIP